MQMPGRSNSYGTGVEYRFGYIGIEKDDEISGVGNKLSTEFRQYDPRLGRWFAPDQLKQMYPSNSQYCYALNSPIAGKDENGLYTIFINGYRYGGVPGSSDDLKAGYSYWRAKKDPNQFVRAAHQYFGDSGREYLDGTGTSVLSWASTRQEEGRIQGKITALELMQRIKEGEHFDEINIVSHSMGAAYAEGLIEELMKYPELAGLLMKGEVVHFSACDGDNIVISDNSKDLRRTQLNYWNDKTLEKADPGAASTGGYQIPGVERFGVVKENVETLHPGKTKDNYDLHYDSKVLQESWDYIKALDKRKAFTTERGTIYLNRKEIEPHIQKRQKIKDKKGDAGSNKKSENKSKPKSKF